MEQGEKRDQLIRMAETWDTLAHERERALHALGDSSEVPVMPDHGKRPP
jgi:hypothetical protein